MHQIISQSMTFSGIMKLKDMYQLYKDSDRIGQYILGLLNKFEVALQFDSDHLLLPSLLPTDEDLLAKSMKEVSVRKVISWQKTWERYFLLLGKFTKLG